MRSTSRSRPGGNWHRCPAHIFGRQTSLVRFTRFDRPLDEGLHSQAVLSVNWAHGRYTQTKFITSVERVQMLAYYLAFSHRSFRGPE